MGLSTNRFCMATLSGISCTKDADTATAAAAHLLGPAAKFKVIDAGSGRISLENMQSNHLCADTGEQIHCYNSANFTDGVKFLVTVVGQVENLHGQLPQHANELLSIASSSGDTTLRGDLIIGHNHSGPRTLSVQAGVPASGGNDTASVVSRSIDSYSSLHVRSSRHSSISLSSLDSAFVQMDTGRECVHDFVRKLHLKYSCFTPRPHPCVTFHLGVTGRPCHPPASWKHGSQHLAETKLFVVFGEFDPPGAA